MANDDAPTSTTAAAEGDANTDAARAAATEPFQVNTDPDYKVSIKLSNPLRAVYAVRLGLQDKDYDINHSVRVTRSSARALIGAGYAQVDPEDGAAVEQALELAPPSGS